MTLFGNGYFDIQRQRGFWLRCFLGVAIVVLLVGLPLSAQIEVQKPERVTHVEGFVVNPEGRPEAGISVKLLRDDKIQAETQTDKAGQFEFEHIPPGSYLFRVSRTHYAPAARDIVVTDEIVTHLERKKLYVILGPGACMDECSAVLTSKREFDRTIREKNRH